MENDKEKIRAALNEVKNKYGFEIARNVERIYRMETSHFRSSGFRNTFSPGMEKHSEIFPWGWVSMKKIWADQSLKPVGFWTAKEGAGISGTGGHVKTFLRFPSVRAAMFSLAEYLLKYRPGRWYSTEAKLSAEYETALLEIIPRFVNQFQS